ncbi:MAG: hypothetical protein WA030_00950 [Candidatus Microsaccharimonas sp.]
MTFTLIMGILATILGLYATVPYVIAILKGKTKPHQFSWLIFVIMNGIVLFSQYFEGGRESVLITLTFFIGSLLIFFLSLKYGTRDTSKWDKLLLTLALLTIIVWVITRSNEAAIWLTLVIDIIATSMIILKLRKQPKSEDPKAWVVATIAYVFTTLSLVGTPFGILYVRPLYGLICDLALVLAIFYFLRKK